MNIFIPNYKETFILEEEFKIEIEGLWRYKNPVIPNLDVSNVTEELPNNRAKITLPEGTVLEVKSIRVRRSEYRNFITFIAYHDSFKGIQYKTVGKILLDVFEPDFKQLKNMEVEILGDTNN